MVEKRVSSEDEALIRGFLQNDLEAIGTIDRWITQASRSFRYRLGNDFEDVLQEIRLEIQVLLRSGKFRRESELKAYVQTVARNTCLDRRRALGRLGQYLLDVDDDVLTQQLQEGLISSSFEPEHEQRDLMRRVVAELPENCWQVWAKIVAGFSYAEIGEALGIREGTLRVRAKRCRQKAIEIREQLSEEDRRDGDAETES